MKRVAVLCGCVAIAIGTGTGPHGDDYGGTLIAAFVTRSNILLCSDGRVVNSADGQVLREDWSKVHRLAHAVGLLTGGRNLPGLLTGIAAAIERRDVDVTRVATATRSVLEREWRQLSTATRPAEGRAVAIVAGFDARGRARVFHFDSDDHPAFRPVEIPLFGRGTELDVVAIATGTGPDQDVSQAIVREVDVLYRRQPSTDRRQLFTTAFNAAKTELGARNSRIGGRTFVAEIDPVGGFRSLQ